MSSRSGPGTPSFVNPYRAHANDGQVRGATLGRLGVAVGVIAVAAASPAGATDHPVPSDTQIWFGTALAIAQEITRNDDSGSGYLWPAPPSAEMPASPALDL
jgi:hypothetical protein